MKHPVTLTAALLAGLSLSAAAQSPAASAAESPNIAVIAFQAAVMQTNEFQRNFADLQKKFEPKRQQLQALNTQIQGLQKELQAQGSTLSDTERESRSRSLNEKEKQMQREQEDDQNDFQQDMQQTFNGVATKVGDVLVAYAKDHNFSLVLDGGEQQTQVVLYAAPTTDITKAIIDAYNVKSGVPAPATPAAPAPSAVKPAPRTTTPHTTTPQH